MLLPNYASMAIQYVPKKHVVVLYLHAYTLRK